MYLYKSKIVSNVECFSIHLVLYKSFSLRFLVSGERPSIAVVKNFSRYGELSKKLNNSWKESIMFWIEFILQAWHITRLMEWTQQPCYSATGAYLASSAWTPFLSEPIDTVVSYALPRQLTSRFWQITHVYQKLALYWVRWMGQQWSQAGWDTLTTLHDPQKSFHLSGDSSQGIFTNRLNHFIWTVLFVYLGPTYFRLFFHVLFLLVGCSKGGLLANQSISLDPSLLIQTYGICRYLQWQLTKYWKVAHWNAKKSLKISKNKKICYLNFKSCYQTFCIFFVNVNLRFIFCSSQ